MSSNDCIRLGEITLLCLRQQVLVIRSFWHHKQGGSHLSPALLSTSQPCMLMQWIYWVGLEDPVSKPGHLSLPHMLRSDEEGANFQKAMQSKGYLTAPSERSGISLWQPPFPECFVPGSFCLHRPNALEEREGKGRRMHISKPCPPADHAPADQRRHLQVGTTIFVHGYPLPLTFPNCIELDKQMLCAREGRVCV